MRVHSGKKISSSFCIYEICSAPFMVILCRFALWKSPFWFSFKSLQLINPKDNLQYVNKLCHCTMRKCKQFWNLIFWISVLCPWWHCSTDMLLILLNISSPIKMLNLARIELRLGANDCGSINGTVFQINFCYFFAFLV